MAIHGEQFNLDLNSLSYTLNIYVGDVKNPVQESFIWNDNIASLIIESDVDRPVIYGKMIYTDRNNLYFNNIDPNNTTFMQMVLVANTVSEQPNDPIRSVGDEFSEVFLIDRVEIIDRAITDVTYEIHFTSNDWSNFNNYLPYSSVGPKKHLSILKDLFNRGGLSLDVSEGATAIDKESAFISPANYTLNDSINYILSISASEDTFVYNFTYDWIKQKYRLFSPKKDFDTILKGDVKAGKLVPANNVLLMNSRFDTPTGKAAKRTIRDVTSENINGATHNVELSKDLLFYHYDQTKREWTTNEVNYNKIVNSLPKETSSGSEIFVNKFVNLENGSSSKFKREIVPREPFIYDTSIREIFNDSKVIKFKTEGWINRKSGEFLYIFVNPKDEMYDKLDGLWFILKVIKNISGSNFEDVVYACRIDRGKPLFNQLFGKKSEGETE
tara:strand:+ start:1090 stop:2415 length:1326 start_codon:yes stop_codon:yes gene_type:complete